MEEHCDIEVTIRRVNERSYKVSTSNFKYTNNYQASLYNDLITIPRSQVLHLKDLGNNRKIMRLPTWLVKKEALDEFIIPEQEAQLIDDSAHDPRVEFAAKTLSEIDSLETWKDDCPSVPAELKADVFKRAEQLWLERNYRLGKLLIHPKVLDQLQNQSWTASGLQKKMIWASILASLEGADSKSRFYVIKKGLLKKYGRDWWEDVYKRKTNAWAAKDRIRKQQSSYGPALSHLTSNTHLFAEAAERERDKALRMIPET